MLCQLRWWHAGAQSSHQNAQQQRRGAGGGVGCHNVAVKLVRKLFEKYPTTKSGFQTHWDWMKMEMFFPDASKWYIVYIVMAVIGGEVFRSQAPCEGPVEQIQGREGGRMGDRSVRQMFNCLKWTWGGFAFSKPQKGCVGFFQHETRRRKALFFWHSRGGGSVDNLAWSQTLDSLNYWPKPESNDYMLGWRDHLAQAFDWCIGILYVLSSTRHYRWTDRLWLW